MKKNEEDKMVKIKPGQSEKRTMLLLQAYFWGCCNHKISFPADKQRKVQNV